MSLLIQDNEWTIDANGVQQVMTGHRPVVRAQSLVVPVFQRPPASGPYVEDESEVRTATAGSGAWTLVLPWPSETRSGVSTWSITRMNGTVVQGGVPEGITGPLTVDDLLFALSGLARADGGAEPYTNWTVLPGQAPADPVAVQPAIIRPRGAWLPDVPYLPGDQVTSSGLVWVALEPSTDVQPPTVPVASEQWGLSAATSLDTLMSALVLFDDPDAPGWVLFPDGELLVFA